VKHVAMLHDVPHCLTTLRYFPVLSILLATLSRKTGTESWQMV